MIHLEDRGPVALLTIDRAERRNALDHEALEQLLEPTAAPATARVVVLTGAGGHFCAGADLTGVEDAGFTDLLREVLATLRDDPRPHLAAVDGAALGRRHPAGGGVRPAGGHRRRPASACPPPSSG